MLLAGILGTGEFRAEMLDVADDFERMADIADKLPDDASTDSQVPVLR